MKYLILLRHGKSEERSLMQSDYSRDLTERGHKDLKKVSAEFLKLEITPAIVLCSAAVRTRSTFNKFEENTGFRLLPVFLKEFYHADADEILSLINIHAESLPNVMFIGHNFAISELASLMSKEETPVLPTSGLIIISFEDEIARKKGKIKAFINPKELH